MPPQRDGCLEQGQADRSKAAATTEAPLVDPEDAPDRSRARDLTMFNLAIDSKLRGGNLAHERPLCATSGRSILIGVEYSGFALEGSSVTSNVVAPGAILVPSVGEFLKGVAPRFGWGTS